MICRFNDAIPFFSENAAADLVRETGQDPSFRLNFDFTAGYAGMVFPCSEELPQNFVVEFEMRGSGVPQTLECKLVDKQGASVWWVLNKNFPIPCEWQSVRFKRRRFVYAWGPTQEPLRDLSRLEIVMSTGGGQGYFEVRNVVLREIPAADLSAAAVDVRATSGQETASAVLEDSARCWVSDEREEQQLEISFNASIEMGGLRIVWGCAPAKRFEIALEHPEDGWRTVEQVEELRGRDSLHFLPDAEARAIRLILRQKAASLGAASGSYEIARVEVLGADFASSWNGFLSRRASGKRGGLFPRYLLREQSYWTVIAENGGTHKALINEEGMVELGYDLPSLEPFIVCDGRLQTWAESTQTQTLAKGFVPIPSVEHVYENLQLRTTAWMGSGQTLYVRYELKNTDEKPQSGAFYAAIRPYQVNPPWQFLNCTGGFVPVERLDLRQCSGRQTAVINGSHKVVSLAQAARFGAFNYWAGDIAEILDDGVFDRSDSAKDVRGYCSGAFEFPFSLQPGQAEIFCFACSHKEAADVCSAEESLRDTLKYWDELLGRVKFSVAAAPEIEDTIRSQLAYILINRHGEAIQPGTRCYRRTWIRDGALTSSALLQFGFHEEVRDFIRWFAPHVFPSGAVPCVVDHRGPDVTPEHDSHGEFLYLIAEYYRYTGDGGLVREMLPQMLQVLGHIQALCGQTTRDGVPEHIRGLLPKSISHEGYSGCPAYSYWDDLWALRGIEGAAGVLRSVGAAREADEFARCGAALEKVIVASIGAAMKVHNISFIPGSADLGDFDATSTTIGVDPCSLLLSRFRPGLEVTFERYWREFEKRADSFAGGERYTPYEWRVVGSLVRLGWIEKAHRALEFFMRHRRPPGWRHWAEVVWADEREPAFIGDAPHGWVGSDFLRAVRSLMLYEQGDELVIGAGIPLEWWAKGICCELPTTRGRIRVQSSPGEIASVEVHGPAMECRIKIPEGMRAIRGADTQDGYARITLPFAGEFLKASVS